jgi:hypothetical protein
VLRALSIALIATSFVSLLTASMSRAAESDPGRVAIVDASIDTAPYLDALEAAGVKVIGRYFSRCPQPEIVPEKRLIDNGGEIRAILAHKAGFGLLSIYQYFNNQPLKLSGKRQISCKSKKGDSLTIEVTLPDADCRPRPVEDCTEVEGAPHSGAEEAEYDARAAVAQAKLVKQPPSTAIYFGVDFDLGNESNEQVIQYFTIVSNELKDNGYLVGVYGNGAALSLLKGERHKAGRHAGQPLVDFTWLNASRGHAGAAEFYNLGAWDLFQSRTDLKLPAGARGAVEIDTDIQNGEHAADYVGFWNEHGQYKVPEARTKAVYDQRRFACSGRAPVVESPDDSPAPAESCLCAGKCPACDKPQAKSQAGRNIGSRIGFGNVVRIGREQAGFVQIDRDEDGIYDGWTQLANLSPTFAERPQYVGDSERRSAAVCPPATAPASTAAVR